MDLLKQIQQIIEGEVKNDATTIAAFSKDASLYKLKPQVVVFPKNSTDIQALVKMATKLKEQGESVSLTPRAAGTDMTGADLSESIIVSMMKFFNHVLKVGKDFAITEPGVYYRDFEKETLKKGLLLPSYPASRELCALGGIVANNSGG